MEPILAGLPAEIGSFLPNWDLWKHVANVIQYQCRLGV